MEVTVVTDIEHWELKPVSLRGIKLNPLKAGNRHTPLAYRHLFGDPASLVHIVVIF